jgi:uncharacterized membrane protein (UPF0127 family)
VRVRQLRTSAGAVVCARCAVASTPWARFVGLQGRRSLAADEGMLFTHTGSVHMFFMRFAIDAVFCDRDLQVLKVVRNLKPWRTASMRGAKISVELPVGGAAGLEPGDRLVLDE